ncbi:hypothetical protein OXX69_004163 [Metschnikowia pulcherrima]
MEKRQSVPNNWKKELRKHYQKHPRYCQKQLQDWYHESFGRSITQGAISRYISHEYDWLDKASAGNILVKTRKRLRHANHPELEDYLYTWIRESQAPVSGPEVVREARQLWPLMYGSKGMPRFSNGWLDGFRKRYEMDQQKRHGEKELGSDQPVVASGEQLIAATDPRKSPTFTESESEAENGHFLGEQVVEPSIDPILREEEVISSIKLVVRYLEQKGPFYSYLISALEDVHVETCENQKDPLTTPRFPGYFS